MNLNLKVGDPQQKNNIVVFFLSSDEKQSDNYLSLSQGLDQNLVNISEIDKKEFFLNLKVTNNSKQNLLILGGEEICGFQIRQNRIVATTTIIPPHSSAIISVNCGEKRRWSPLLNDSIKVSKTLFFSRQNLGIQHKIWNEIKDVSDKFKVKTFTFSVEDIYKKKEQSIKEIENFFKPKPGATGVVVAVNNQIKTLDVFPSYHMLKVYLKKIIRSVALNNFKKINHKTYLKSKDVHKFLRLVHQSEKHECKVNRGTLGKRIRFIGETTIIVNGESTVIGTILYNENHIVHCSAFTRDIVANGSQKEYNVA